jgi:hypothetical protein
MLTQVCASVNSICVLNVVFLQKNIHVIEIKMNILEVKWIFSLLKSKHIVVSCRIELILFDPLVCTCNITCGNYVKGLICFPLAIHHVHDMCQLENHLHHALLCKIDFHILHFEILYMLVL